MGGDGAIDPLTGKKTPRYDHKAVWLRFYEATVEAGGKLEYREWHEFPPAWEPGNQAYQGELFRWAAEDELRVLTPYYVPSAHQLTFLLDRYFEVTCETIEDSLRSSPGIWPDALLAAPQLRRQMGHLGAKIRPWHFFRATSLKFDGRTGKPRKLEQTLDRMLGDLPDFERKTSQLERSEARRLSRPET